MSDERDSYARGTPEVTLTRTPEPDELPAPPSEPVAPRHDKQRYDVLAEHGRGGLGCVWRARDRELGRDVAIKELISRGTTSELRFLREALITARLEHPGIVPVHEAGRWADGTPFYAMKLVAGRPLRELIAERPAVEDRIGLLHHVIAVADAIAYAHGRGIIHRDLKPGNVIVGDFGETVVIDWGLAKDLRAAEDSAEDARGSSGDAIDPELTATGSVLGTPAYMAPEQARGLRVDQRADVFAIGTMLWELCSLAKAPLNDSAERRRMLRSAGIAADLIAIIEKALEAEPAARYADAGELAADLKAFKAGARITARRYSPAAKLRLWTRQHRVLTAVAVAGVVIAATASVLYIHGVAVERDRTAAAAARQQLEHAELLLEHDPSAADDLLAAYRGDEADRLARLRAKAAGLGLASLRAAPHHRQVYFAERLDDGNLVTLAADGTVAKTAASGASRVIARDVTPQYTFAYARAARQLAYACHATGVCLLDVAREQPLPAPAERAEPTCLAFSPNEQQLAAIAPDGEITVWKLGAPTPALRYRDKIASGDSIHFVDDDTLAVESSHDVESIDLARSRPRLVVEHVGHTDTSAALHTVITATEDGVLAVIDTHSQAVERSAPACKGRVTRLLLLPRRNAAAYACQDGDAGVMTLGDRELAVVAHLEGGAASLATSDDNRYLIIGGVAGGVTIYDFATQLASVRRGHVGTVLALVPPGPGAASVATGDAQGGLRVWPVPDDAVRVALTTPTRMLRAAPLVGGTIVALGYDTLQWARGDEDGDLPRHTPRHGQLVVSPHAVRFASYGIDDEVELWSIPANAHPADAALQVLRSLHGPVTAVAFTPDDELIVGHRDGALRVWPIDTLPPRELGTIGEPVAQLAPGWATGASGATWRIGAELTRASADARPDAAPDPLRSHDGRWRAELDGHGGLWLRSDRWFYIATGATALSDAAFSLDDARLVATDPSGRAIAIDLTAPRFTR